MYRQALLTVLSRIRKSPFFAISVDETRDLSGHEQLSLSVRFVANDGTISEDFIGMYDCVATDAETITKLIYDMLLRCNLDAEKLRGQTYDGASALQGRISGVATRIKEKHPKALSIHCLNHCLNLILNEAAQSCVLIISASAVTHDIHELIRGSPKRLATFERIRTDFASEDSDQTQRRVTLKPICPTRFVLRTAAFSSLISNYQAVIATLVEIQEAGGSTEAARKTPGLHSLLEKFETYFGLHVSLSIFSICEDLATSLQSKTITASEVTRVVRAVDRRLENMRTVEEFNALYDRAINQGGDAIALPALPRHASQPHRMPRRFDDGQGEPHRWTSPPEYFRARYFMAIDLIKRGIGKRFDQDTLAVLDSVEQLVLSACKGRTTSTIPEVLRNIYEGDIDTDRLIRQLNMLPELVTSYNEHAPDERLKKITSINTVLTLLDSDPLRRLYSEVHRILLLYLTVPMSSANCERTFSRLRLIKSYLRSSLRQDRLNHLLFLSAYKDVTDAIDLKSIMLEFVNVNDSRRSFFGNIQ